MGYEMLELYEAKVSCTVLRGERRSNPPDLPDDCGSIRPLSVWGVSIVACVPGNGRV